MNEDEYTRRSLTNEYQVSFCSDRFQPKISVECITTENLSNRNFT